MKGAQAQEGRMWVSEHTDRTHKPRTGITIKRKREITHSQVINRSQKVAQSQDVDVRLGGRPLPDKNRPWWNPQHCLKEEQPRHLDSGGESLDECPRLRGKLKQLPGRIFKSEDKRFASCIPMKKENYRSSASPQKADCLMSCRGLSQNSRNNVSPVF